ncbi:hypothetical protein CLCR_05304 [Cladophialophora carrionii]|uniref:Uncharacterized protein n=1 Tax=Cladophialophora carrionii TaxID=86049 RepID=A0A1C1CLH2_9EURO|nr:hypothetical protein CLCR_05304 [Cladophialophora carrionii]
MAESHDESADRSDAGDHIQATGHIGVGMLLRGQMWIVTSRQSLNLLDASTSRTVHTLQDTLSGVEAILAARGRGVESHEAR